MTHLFWLTWGYLRQQPQKIKTAPTLENKGFALFFVNERGGSRTPDNLIKSCVFESILVICQELFEKDFGMYFRKKGNFNRPSILVFLKIESQFDSILNSVSSFSPVYSWFLTSNPKTSRTNLRDVSASALLC